MKQETYNKFWICAIVGLLAFGLWAVEEIAHAISGLKEYKINDAV